MSSPLTWKISLTADEADLAVRALRLSQTQCKAILGTYGDRPIRFCAELAHDRCEALANKIASIAGVEDGS